MLVVVGLLLGAVLLGLMAFGVYATGGKRERERWQAERQWLADALAEDALDRAHAMQRVLDYYDPPQRGWRKDGTRPKPVEYDGYHELSDKVLKGEKF